MTLILHTGGDVVAVNQYFDLRILGSHSWRGQAKFGAPVTDLVDEVTDPLNLMANVANLFPGGLLPNNQGIDCWEQNYPPYHGDTVLLGQRRDNGGVPNDGTYLHAGVGAHSTSQIVLVYWNTEIGVTWEVPAHRLRINRAGEGVFEPWIPAMKLPFGAARALFVMADSTVILGDTLMAPSRGLDDFPLYVPPDDNVWCPPLDFIYNQPIGNPDLSKAPCKRLQDQCNGQRIQTVMHARMSLDREIVCGVVGKDGAIFALLCYDFPQGAPADMFCKVVCEYRFANYDDGIHEPPLWTQATPITGAGEFIDGANIVTPPGDAKLFAVKWLLPFSLAPTEPPPELEIRFKRIARDVGDTAGYLDFLGGGVFAWFWSPYQGPGL